MSTDYARLAAVEGRQTTLWRIEDGRLVLWAGSRNDVMLLEQAERAWGRGIDCLLADVRGQVIWERGEALIWHQAEVRPADLISLEEFNDYR